MRTSRSIVVTNTPDVLTESVADFTWALILAITRRVSEGERLVRRGEWKGWALDFMLGSELRGKQLGLVGLGRIGRAVAARAPAFGMRVAYASRRAGDVAGAEQMSLDRLLNTSDVVSLHVPLTPETRHLIDKKTIARMKRSAYLVNTARGAIVDEAALAWAMQQRLLAGAALDVYENEPADPSGSAAARKRPAGAASRQRHDGDADRDGRSAAENVHGGARRPPGADAGARMNARLKRDGASNTARLKPRATARLKWHAESSAKPLRRWRHRRT